MLKNVPHESSLHRVCSAKVGSIAGLIDRGEYITLGNLLPLPTNTALILHSKKREYH